MAMLRLLLLFDWYRYAYILEKDFRTNKVFVNKVHSKVPSSLLKSHMFTSLLKLSMALTSNKVMVVILRKSLNIIVTHG